MAVAWGHRYSGPRSRRNAGSLPVLRWLRVGAATAGLGVALVAAPAVAQADTGTPASSTDSSQGAEPSAGTETSPNTDGDDAAADRDDQSEDASSSPGQETSTRAGQDGPEDTQDEADAISSDIDPVLDPAPDDDPVLEDNPSPEDDPVPDDDSLDELAEDASVLADPPETIAEESPAAAAATETSRSSELSHAEDSRSILQVSPPASRDGSPEPAVDEDSAVPDLTDSQPISASPSIATAIAATPTLRVAAPEASSSGRPDYPAPVDAPVTWRAIVIETLTWLGGDAGTNLPVPNDPVPDLLAGLWMGMRRLQYTLFNSGPVLRPSASNEDVDTGIITGDLQGYDANGDVITYLLTSAPAHGTVLIADDGTYTYTPDADFTGGTDTFSVTAEDTGPANPWHIHPFDDLRSGLNRILPLFGFEALPEASTATVTVHSASTPPVAPSITLHNDSGNTIWVYNLPKSGDYSIKATFTPVSVANGESTQVTLAPGTGALGTPENRIYIVEGDEGFTVPVDATSGVDAFNPTAVTAGNSFLNYNFLEYFLYTADGGSEYTIDTSYIDEWSLPVQYKFTIPDGTDWTGAKSGTTYGFSDYDTVVNQLKAAEKAGQGPYSDLIWSGSTPFGPQPPASVSRIIGPNKVWTAQSLQPPSNVNMNNAGWVPTSYQDFVQSGATTDPTTYPYAQDGKKYSTEGNFTFWKDSVDGPASTPYPMALRTAAIHDGFPAVDGVYGFFTYPNDETAGQFTNIPSSVSLDIHVHGTSDGVSDSVIEGGSWFYTSPKSPSESAALKHGRDVITGTGATDTFILDSVFKKNRTAPLVVSEAAEGDIVVVDRAALGATSFEVDVVDCFWFLGGGFANYDSQFVYDRSSGYLYYDEDPGRFGYTGVLAKLDPSNMVYVL